MMEVLEGSQSLRRNAVLLELMGNYTVSCMQLDQRILLAARLHEKVAKMTSRNVCQVPFTRNVTGVRMLDRPGNVWVAFVDCSSCANCANNRHKNELLRSSLKCWSTTYKARVEKYEDSGHDLSAGNI